MASYLSNLPDNLAERIHKIKCKYGHNNEKCETSRIKDDLIRIAVRIIKKRLMKT